MVSRRNFITITMMMVVLVFLFQFSGVMKETWNDYDKNEYTEISAAITAKDNWNMMLDESQIDGTRDYVIYIGDSGDDGIGAVVTQWCQYTKRGCLTAISIAGLELPAEYPPEAILLDSAYVNPDEDITLLRELANRGVSLVFCNIPEYSVLKTREDYRRLLGISYIISEHVELSGVQLFKGFLLGGETRYIAEREEDQKRQDMQLQMPWYATLSGTKTYMVGLLEGQEIVDGCLQGVYVGEMMENGGLYSEYQPGIIWRNSALNGRIFVVNGSFMEDAAGIGILSAMMAELHSYELYPVVNAQNLTILNYPGLADENAEKMNELYSRPQRAVYRDIIWPGIAAVAEYNNAKLSCMLMPQYDYQDSVEPAVKDLIYYQKVLKEIHAELGLSASCDASELFTDKLKRDTAFFEEAANGYEYLSLYIESGQSLKTILAASISDKVRTILTSYNQNSSLLGFADEQRTVQSATIEGSSHTYREDFRVKSLETALGYSSIVLDMNRIAWPETKEDSWEKVYEQFSGNTNTYWKPFQVFAKTTLTESDTRIRDFLAMDYTDTRTADRVILKITNRGGQAWFILRTHGEEIDEITGASYEKIEDGAYLIGAQEDIVGILLKPVQELYYYDK